MERRNFLKSIGLLGTALALPRLWASENAAKIVSEVKPGDIDLTSNTFATKEIDLRRHHLRKFALDYPASVWLRPLISQDFAGITYVDYTSLYGIDYAGLKEKFGQTSFKKNEDSVCFTRVIPLNSPFDGQGSYNITGVDLVTVYGNVIAKRRFASNPITITDSVSLRLSWTISVPNNYEYLGSNRKSGKWSEFRTL